MALDVETCIWFCLFWRVPGIREKLSGNGRIREKFIVSLVQETCLRLATQTKMAVQIETDFRHRGFRSNSNTTNKQNRHQWPSSLTRPIGVLYGVYVLKCMKSSYKSRANARAMFETSGQRAFKIHLSKLKLSLFFEKIYLKTNKINKTCWILKLLSIEWKSMF